MANNKILICDVLLIVAGAYGIIAGHVSGKKYATVALALYITSAALGIANEISVSNIVDIIYTNREDFQDNPYKYNIYASNGVMEIPWLPRLSIVVTSDSDLRKVDSHVYYITNVAGIDLLLTDVCVASSVDPKLSLLNLIPPAVDLLMRYVIDDSWDPITPFTHIVSVGLLVYFAIRDQKFILIGSAVCFLLAIFGGRRQDPAFVNGFNGGGVFFTSFFLGGKDLKDLGIDI